MANQLPSQNLVANNCPLVIFVGFMLQHGCRLLTLLSVDGRLCATYGVGTCTETSGCVAVLILDDWSTLRPVKNIQPLKAGDTE